MLLLVYLTIAYTQAMKSNISVDILFRKFPQDASCRICVCQSAKHGDQRPAAKAGHCLQ